MVCSVEFNKMFKNGNKHFRIEKVNWAYTIYVERRKGCEDEIQPIEQCEYGQCFASGFRNPMLPDWYWPWNFTPICVWFMVRDWDAGSQLVEKAGRVDNTRTKENKKNENKAESIAKSMWNRLRKKRGRSKGPTFYYKFHLFLTKISTLGKISIGRNLPLKKLPLRTGEEEY